LGFRVQGSGFRVWGSEFRVEGFGHRVQVRGVWYLILDSGLKVWGCRIYGSSSLFFITLKPRVE